MKNVAIINASDFGSTGKMALGLFSFLKKNNYSVLFCYCRGNKYKDDDYYRMTASIGRVVNAFFSKLFGATGCFSHLETYILIRKLKRRKVNTIYAFNLHGYFINETMFFSYLKKNSIRFIYVMIDEYPFRGKCCIDSSCERYMIGCGNCPQVHKYPESWFLDRSDFIYKMKERNYHNLSNAVFVAPEFVINKARVAPLTKNIELGILDEAINTDFYKPSDYSKLAENLMVDCNKKIIVTTAGSKSEHKGGRYFIQLAERFSNNEDFVFIHVGNGDAKPSDYPANYIGLGYIASNDDIVKLLSMADLFVFPSLSDTQSNVCLEALSCGTPLLLFNISGMPYIVNESVGTLVEPRNVDQLESVVLKVQKKTEEQINTCRRYALSRFSYNDYAQKLVSIAETT